MYLGNVGLVVTFSPTIAKDSSASWLVKNCGVLPLSDRYGGLGQYYLGPKVLGYQSGVCCSAQNLRISCRYLFIIFSVISRQSISLPFVVMNLLGPTWQQQLVIVFVLGQSWSSLPIHQHPKYATQLLADFQPELLYY